MKLENQVVSLELAKKLKELGVKQESLFYFFQSSYSGSLDLGTETDRKWWEHNQFNDETVTWDKQYSTFTVAELGEMLPANIEVDEFSFYKEKGLAYLNCNKHSKWEIKYIVYKDGTGYVVGGYADSKLNKKGGICRGDTEADTRAKMLIYLLENKLI